ncbi:MAG TPA: ABC transporter permease subunit, partial [Candidatus Limnocylindrales bacterium]|nr:ABC transporter permease subunit [Candidatus Limnocylindrales bacterium]
MPILRFASLTLAEVVRRRVAWVLIGLTLLSVLATTWGIERLLTLARQHGGNELEISVGVSQVLILVAFMFSFVLAMTAAFLGAPAIAADLESGVAHAMLARPIRRADLVIGRWLG